MKLILKIIGQCFISVCFIGYLPVLHGTTASAVSIPMLLLMHELLPINIWIRGGIIVLIVLIIYFLSIFWIKKNVDSKEYDQSFIVIDEVLGMIIAMLPVLLIYADFSVYSILAFVLFRILDGWKPGFIRKIDQMNTPHGVLLDDLAAGALGAAIMFPFALLL